MSRFFASYARATAGFFGICLAAVSGVIAYFLWRGAHWINLESVYFERQLYESNPPNPFWLDLASGFPLYIPALIFAGIPIAVVVGFIREFTSKEQTGRREPNNG